MDQKKKTTADKNYDLLTKAHNDLYGTIGKNNNHFETKVTYISSGVIVLSFTFIQGLIVGDARLFMLGNVLAGIALIINLSSYFIGNHIYKRNADLYNTLRQVKCPNQMPVDDYVYKKAIEANKSATKINYLTLLILAFSIIILSIFFTTNILAMKTNKQQVFNSEIETKGEITVPTISTDNTNGFRPAPSSHTEKNLMKK